MDREQSSLMELCWVCLQQDSSMYSLLQDYCDVYLDNNTYSISLEDLLKALVSTDILFIGGPHKICIRCKYQACAAYKFKMRCETSKKLIKKYELVACDKQTYLEHANNIELNKREVTSVQLEVVGDVNNFNDDQIKTASESETLDICCDSGKSCRNIHNIKLKVFHKRKQNKVKSSHFTCSFCEKKFKDGSNLRVHTRTHTGEYPFVCSICNKSFISSTSLKIHKRVHDNSKPYKCHLCCYSCRTSSHLQVHVKRHNGIKNYQCQECGYKACTKAELRNHFVSHTEDKCFTCKTCEKSFARINTLKAHEKSHLGLKPFLCELCGRRLAYAHSYRSHLKKIHGLL